MRRKINKYTYKKVYELEDGDVVSVRGVSFGVKPRLPRVVAERTAILTKAGEEYYDDGTDGEDEAEAKLVHVAICGCEEVEVEVDINKAFALGAAVIIA